MIEIIFDACVVLLVWGAGLLGISYKAINVWIFVVIWPLFTLVLIGIVVYQWRKMQALRSLSK
ncbi:MAG: hypothetical protein DWQ07_24160 [Chloroflexi bacterium]|nr:MAG: hypothetical protein DWQ07_24160 [Chloroflexota bacterium]MBL1196228.1 hypothetical protein [Chloroflexota bacterium]NOH13522.1 hypothetical protein [Chloroflexota bacterium]